MVGLVISPHPHPLPQGEGTARIAQRQAEGCGLFSAERKVHPLPKGEGWGEGKEPIAPRGVDVLALAYGPCPQRYLALSPSRFQASTLPEVADLGTRHSDFGFIEYGLATAGQTTFWWPFSSLTWFEQASVPPRPPSFSTHPVP